MDTKYSMAPAGLKAILFSSLLLLLSQVARAQCQFSQVISSSDTVRVCLGMGSNVISFTNSLGSDNNYAYVLTNENDTIVSQIFNAQLDASLLATGEYHVFGVHYSIPPLTVPTGQPITSVQSLGCVIISTNWIAIYADNPISPADAGEDVEVCDANSIFFDGSTAVNGTGIWDQFLGPVKAYIFDPTNPNTEAAGFIPGTYHFEWLVYNEGCGESRDTFIVNYYQPIPNFAGNDQFLCGASSATLEANNPPLGTGEWNTIAGPTNVFFADVNDPNTQVTSLITGDYQFEWTITNGTCITRDTVDIKNVAAPTTANAGVDRQLCEVTGYTLEGNTAQVGTGTWTLLSGPPNSFFLEANQPNTQVQGLKDGTYEFIWTITNEYCVSADTVTYEFFDKPELGATSTDVSVFGAMDGIIEVCVITGTAPFTVSYSPDNVGTLASVSPNACLDRYEITGLPGGFFDLYVIDANGCTDTIFNQEIKDVDCSSFAITSVAPADETCFDADNGTITIAITGGIGDFTYNIGNGIPEVTTSASSYTFQNLPAGTYSIISVTDQQGCQTFSPISATINQPTELTLSAVGMEESTVGANDGSINVCVNGGDPSYQIALSPNVGIQINQGPVTCDANFQFINLPPDVYTVSLSDQSGCTKEVTVVIGSPSCTIAIDQVIVSATPACNGDKTGTLVVFASGSTNYQFSSDGGVTFTPSTSSNGYTFNNLAAGSYNIVVSDGNFCQTIYSQNPVEITEPAAVEGVASPTGITAVGANDGRIDLCINGGTPGYAVTYVSYAGLSGNFFNQGGGSCTGNFALTNLPSDTFDIFIADSEGCPDSIFTVVVLPAICSNYNVTGIVQTPVSCVGSVDGTIGISINGGQSPYLYIINDGVEADSSDLTLSTDYTFFDLAPGAYTLTVIDDNDCALTEFIEVTEPDPVLATIAVVDPTLIGVNNGEICITPSGGDASYTVTSTCGTVLPGPGLACTGDFHISNVAPGDCTIMIEDGKGCTYQETVNLIDPACVTYDLVGVSAMGVSCFGETDGTITIVVSGGNAPYFYSIDGGFTFASSQDPSFTFPGLEPDSYEVEVKDDNDCSFVYTVPVEIGEPSPLSIVFDPFPTCLDGSTGKVAAEVIGGTPPYTYLWSTGDTGAMIENLAPGSYGLSVNDINGCFKAGSVILEELQAVAVDAGQDIEILEGDTAFLGVVTNALPPYDIEWSPATDLDDPTAETPQATPSETVTYLVTVTSREGCVGTDEIVVTVIPRGLLDVPTGFTPNDDGMNDEFSPIAKGSTIVTKFMVFNRWGEMIHNETNPWDGRYNGEDQPVGTYIYIVEYIDEEGKNEKISGHVSLLK